VFRHENWNFGNKARQQITYFEIGKAIQMVKFINLR
jgi:hypothetical protein